MTDIKRENEMLAQALALIIQHRQELQRKESPVINFKLPSKLKNEIDLTIPHKGTGDQQLIENLRNYLKFAVKTAHPHFANQLFGGFALPSFLGEIFSTLTNTSMYTYEMAPLATLMELEVIKKMNSFVGWENGEGSLLTGGSNTNLVAMILARNEKFPEAKDKGISQLPPLKIFVSERSHFSFTKAANAIGIGREGVVTIPVDSQGCMIAEELENEIQQSLDRGEAPFMVCATAGTTETGSFDPIEETGNIARKYNLWFHVDGSWGGSLILNKKFKHLFNGLSLADSFSWNPHKLMSIPLICSALLVRKQGTLLKQLSTEKTDYIFHNNETSEYDLGPSSLQCGKRNDALKLWMAWQYFGDEGYANRMEYLMELAKYATDYIQNDQDLELMFPTQTLNVNFRFNNGAIANLDEFNETLRNNVIRTGKAMVNYCHLQNGLSIRMIFLNPEMTREDITEILEIFKNEAHQILKKSSATVNV